MRDGRAGEYDQVGAFEIGKRRAIVAGEHMVGATLIAAVFDVEDGFVGMCFHDVAHLVPDLGVPVLNGDEIDGLRILVAVAVIMHRDEAIVTVECAQTRDAVDDVLTIVVAVAGGLLGNIPNEIRVGLIAFDHVVEVALRAKQPVCSTRRS